jgi:hypothetical protein
MGTLGDRGVVLPAESVVQRQFWRDLPIVFDIGVVIAAVDGSRTDVCTI